MGGTAFEPVKDDASRFGEAEQLLLDEARERFDLEQRWAVSLHSKSTLFLTLTSVFAVFIVACIGRFLDHGPTSFLALGALVVLLVSLGLLTIAAILLGRSALARSYEVIAAPSHWVKHLACLRQSLANTSNPDETTLGRLRWDILDAWVEAAQACSVVNDEKASVLERVSKLLYLVPMLTFLGLLLLVLQRLIN
jgi:hypothetical protein